MCSNRARIAFEDLEQLVNERDLVKIPESRGGFRRIFKLEWS